MQACNGGRITDPRCARAMTRPRRRPLRAGGIARSNLCAMHRGAVVNARRRTAKGTPVLRDRGARTRRRREKWRSSDRRRGHRHGFVTCDPCRVVRRAAARGTMSSRAPHGACALRVTQRADRVSRAARCPLAWKMSASQNSRGDRLRTARQHALSRRARSRSRCHPLADPPRRGTSSRACRRRSRPTRCRTRMLRP